MAETVQERLRDMVGDVSWGPECSFCGSDPYEYVNNGVGMEKVAVSCCELGCAVYDHSADGEYEVPITINELRDIGCKIAGLKSVGREAADLIDTLIKQRDEAVEAAMALKNLVTSPLTQADIEAAKSHAMLIRALLPPTAPDSAGDVP